LAQKFDDGWRVVIYVIKRYEKGTPDDTVGRWYVRNRSRRYKILEENIDK